MADKITRDEQVVASKLSALEFSNFKKLCDIETKTPSTKIRELINEEVNNKFGNLYKSVYDNKKVKEFELYTIEDYNSSLIVDKICKVNFVDRTDGKFTQIALRPIINEDIFLPIGNTASILPSLGRFIAIEESEFLISFLIKNKEIKILQIKDPKEFPNFLESDETVILLSTKFYVDFLTSFIKRISFTERYERLDQKYDIITIPEKTLGNKIIIIEKNSILWSKQKFFNQFTNKEEGLDISITPMIGEKVDIIVRSMNKIKSIYPNGIKILEVNHEK